MNDVPKAVYKGRAKCPHCGKKGVGFANHPHAYGQKDYSRFSCRYCGKTFKKKDETVAPPLPAPPAVASDDVKNAKAKWEHSITVKSCARCGKDHKDLKFVRFAQAQPDDRHTHWAVCPNTLEPILLVIEDDAPEAHESDQGVEIEGVPHLGEADKPYRLAKERYLTAMGGAMMEGSIRLLWKKLDSLLKPEVKNQAFHLVAISLITAWKKGYEHEQKE